MIELKRAKTYVQAAGSKPKLKPIEIATVRRPVAHPVSAWKISCLHCALLLVLYLIVYLGVYDEKLYLGGDNLHYYFLGKALAQGQGYSNTIAGIATPHNHFPPGYPFIISLFIRMGAGDFSFYNYLNGAFGLASVWLLYFFTLKTTGSRALGFVAGFVLSFMPVFQGMTHIAMSEVPGLFFTISALSMLVCSHPDKPIYKDYHFGLVLACTIISYYIRSSAIALLPAVLMFYLLRKKWLRAIITMAGFAIAIAPWVIRTQRLGGSSYLHQFAMKNPYWVELGLATTGDYMLRIVANLKRYISVELPGALLQDLFPGLNGPRPVFYWTGGIMLLLLFLSGMVLLFKKQPALITYLAGGCAILLIWPEVWGGSRFMMPLLPFIVLLILYTLHTLLSALTRKLRIPWNPLLLCAFFFPFLIGPLKTMHANAAEPYEANYQNYFSAAEWARDHLPATAVIASRKPELFYFFAHRNCTSYLFDPDAARVLHRLEEDKVTVVVVDQLGFSSTPRYLVPVLQKYPGRFRLLYRSPPPETYLFELLRR